MGSSMSKARAQPKGGQAEKGSPDDGTTQLADQLGIDLNGAPPSPLANSPNEWVRQPPHACTDALAAHLLSMT